ncbi:DUF6083 domain-containing protein [Streptomyces sp. NPDC059900]|uniref:DUF6083 domain-containing protein n=1 Tax=Streptomyces sp. NPDC059900 TaxID=3155816 RepID=UPI0034212C3E
MGEFDEELSLPERQPGESDDAYWRRVGELTDRAEALDAGADADGPPARPVCRECGLEADRFETWFGAWVLLERLDPVAEVPAHMVPPFFRWVIDRAGMACWTRDAEPSPGAMCRIPHRLVCPGIELPNPWSWLASVRSENARAAERLYNPPPPREPDEGLPDVG